MKNQSERDNSNMKNKENQGEKMSNFIPNSFQLPNAFVDEMLDKVSGNACKVYLLIVRKTRGWNKEKDRISYSQIQKISGIKSHETIKNALDELVKIGLILVKQGNEKLSNQYSLNDSFGTTEIVEQKSKGTTKTVEATTEIVEQGTTEIVDTENNSFKTTMEEANEKNPPPQNSQTSPVEKNTVTEEMITQAIDYLTTQGLLNSFEPINREEIRFEIIQSMQFRKNENKPVLVTLANYLRHIPAAERIARFQNLPQAEIIHPSHIVASAPVVQENTMTREEKLARIAMIERGEMP